MEIRLLMNEQDIKNYTEQLVDEYFKRLSSEAVEKKIKLEDYLRDQSPLMVKFISEIKQELRYTHTDNLIKKGVRNEHKRQN